MPFPKLGRTLLLAAVQSCAVVALSISPVHSAQLLVTGTHEITAVDAANPDGIKVDGGTLYFTLATGSSLTNTPLTIQGPVYITANGGAITVPPLSLSDYDNPKILFAQMLNGDAGARLDLKTDATGDVFGEYQFFAGFAANNTLQITNEYNTFSIYGGTAGSATITNARGGYIEFGKNYSPALGETTPNYDTTLYPATTAGRAIITNLAPSPNDLTNQLVVFKVNATAGNAVLNNNNEGLFTFTYNSSAGAATINNHTGGRVFFEATSSAGNSVITNDAGGKVYFRFSSSGNNATLINNGTLYLQDRFDTPALTIGQLSGTGNIFLGKNTLTLGSLSSSGTISGVIADRDISMQSNETSGSLIKTGTGALTLTAANTYTGGTAIAAGTLRLAGTNTITSSSGLSLASGAVLDISPSSGVQTIRGLSGAGVIILGSTSLVLDTNASSTYSGSITGTGGFIKNGTGTLTLTSSSAGFSGGMIVNGGSIQIGDGGFNMGSAGTGPVTLNNSASLEFNHGVGILNVGSVISGNGVVRNTGQGNTILSANNTYSGGTDIRQGNIFVGDGGTFGSVGSGTITISSSAGLYLNRTDIITLANTITNNGIVAQNNTGTTILTGIISGTGAVSVGSGTLQIGNGGTTGTLASTGNISTSSSASLIFNRSDNVTVNAVIFNFGKIIQNGSGTLTLASTASYLPGSIIVNNGILQINGASSPLGSITTNAALVLANDSALTLGGVIDGTGSLLKTGNGVLTLVNANSYTGGTTLAGGTVLIGDNQAFGNTPEGRAGQVSVIADSTVQTSADRTIGARFQIDDGKSLTLNIANNTTLTISRSSINTTGGALSFNNNAQLTRTNTGQLTFSSNSASIGGAIYAASNLTIAGKTLFQNNTAMTIGGAIHMNGDSPASILTLDTSAGDIVFTGNQQNYATTATANSIYLQKNTSLLITGSNNLYLDDPINASNSTGNNTLTVSGTGTVQLAGNSVINPTGTAGGSVTVSNGTLRMVDGASLATNGAAASFTLTAPATLAGNGTISAEQGIILHGTIAPDSDRFVSPLDLRTTLPRPAVSSDKTIGILSFAGNTQFDGSKLSLDLANDGTSDKISVNGVVTFGTNQNTIDISTWANGNFEILSATSIAPIDSAFANVTVGGLALGPRQRAVLSLVNGTTLTLATTSSQSLHLLWNGTSSSELNLIDNNWTNLSATEIIQFASGDSIVFDDSASLKNITVGGTAIIVSGMEITGGQYTFSGGKIIGDDTSAVGTDAMATGKLLITGTNTAVTINNETDFAQGVEIAGGTVTIANDKALGLYSDSSFQRGIVTISGNATLVTPTSLNLGIRLAVQDNNQLGLNIAPNSTLILSGTGSPAGTDLPLLSLGNNSSLQIQANSGSLILTGGSTSIPGGAISSFSTATLDLSPLASLTVQNNLSFAGAIFSIGDLVLGTKTTVNGNIGAFIGGGIVAGQNLTIAGQSRFTNNLVGSNSGGAIFMANIADTIQTTALLDTSAGDIVFSGNKQGVDLSDITRPSGGNANSFFLWKNIELHIIGPNSVYLDDPIDATGGEGGNSFVKDGPGLVQFNGTSNLNPQNTPGGSISINNGTLRIVQNAVLGTDGDNATFTLASPATLAGGGTLAATQGINIQGTLSPDNDIFSIPAALDGTIHPTVSDARRIGILTLNGNVTLSGATLLLDIAAGNVSDRIVINGTRTGSAELALNAAGTLNTRSTGNTWTILSMPGIAGDGWLTVGGTTWLDDTVKNIALPSGGALGLKITYTDSSVQLTSLEKTNAILRGTRDTPLSSGSAWETNIQSTPPDADSIATWVAHSDSSDNMLGENTTWGGIEITQGVSAPVSIGATGETLSLGSYGIVLNEAGNDLTLNAGLTLAADQGWNIGQGKTLTLNAPVNGAGIKLNVIGAIHFNDTASLGTLTVATLANTSGSSDPTRIDFAKTARIDHLTFSSNGVVSFADTATVGILDSTGSDMHHIIAAQLEITTRLAGKMTIDGNVHLANGAVVAPGNSPGTIAINGNLSLSSGSVYEAEMASATEYDKLVVSGTATVNGAGLKLVSLGGYAPAPGTTIAVLNAAGGIIGDFTEVSGSWVALGLTLEKSADGKGYAVKISQNSFVQPAQTKGQATIGAALDGIVTAAPGSPLITKLNQFSSTEQLNSAIASLSPQVYQRWFENTVYGDQALMRTVEAHLASVAHTPDVFPKQQATREAAGYDNTLLPSPNANLWAQYIHRETSYNAQGGDIPGADGSSNGVVLGADLAPLDGLNVGLLFAYTSERINLSPGSKSEIDHFVPAVYARYGYGGFFMDGMFGWGFSDGTSDRAIFDGIASSDNDQQDRFVSGRIGYEARLRALQVTPYLGVQHIRWTSDSFTEHGAGDANLHVNDQAGESLATRLGTSFAIDLPVAQFTLTPKIDAAWRHEFQDSRREIGARFASYPGSDFVVTSSLPGQNALEVAAGFDLRLTNAWTINANVALYWDGKGDAQDYRIGLNWQF